MIISDLRNSPVIEKLKRDEENIAFITKATSVGEMHFLKESDIIKSNN